MLVVEVTLLPPVQSVLRAMVLTGAMVTVPGQEESVLEKMQIMTPTLATLTVTSVGTNASTITSPAMGHVMKIDTNVGASVFTIPVSVEQSH